MEAKPIKPTNHCEICQAVMPHCLCNSCKKDNPDEACCRKHQASGCMIENCPDYENEREAGYDF